MFPLKACLKLSFLLVFFSLPVLAQSYSHEFENPDGSSHLCTSDFSGNTGKTRCVKVPLDERIKHQKKLINMHQKANYCAALTTPRTFEDIIKPEYSFSAYLKCMGKCNPGSPYIESCNNWLFSTRLNRFRKVHKRYQIESRHGSGINGSWRSEPSWTVDAGKGFRFIFQNLFWPLVWLRQELGFSWKK